MGKREAEATADAEPGYGSYGYGGYGRSYGGYGGYGRSYGGYGGYGYGKRRLRLLLMLLLSLAIEAMDTAAMADLMEDMVDMAGPMEDMVDMAMASEYLLTQTCFSNPTLLFMLQLSHVSLQNS